MAVTQITPVKGRFEAVKSNLRRWLKTPIDQLVLVDYACPDALHHNLWSLPEASDPRIQVVRVNSAAAGPFYNHSRARNIGAQASKFDCLLFVDADSFVLPNFVEFANQRIEKGLCDVITTFRSEDIARHVFKHLPLTWTTDGQIVVRNSLFFELNGFNEEVSTWGGETYDFLIRAAQSGYEATQVETMPWLQHAAHTDALRDRFMPTCFHDTFLGKDRMFIRSMRGYAARRKVSLRGQPGRKLGLQVPTRDVLLINRRVSGIFRPNE